MLTLDTASRGGPLGRARGPSAMTSDPGDVAPQELAGLFDWHSDGPLLDVARGRFNDRRGVQWSASPDQHRDEIGKLEQVYRRAFVASPTTRRCAFIAVPGDSESIIVLAPDATRSTCLPRGSRAARDLGSAREAVDPIWLMVMPSWLTELALVPSLDETMTIAGATLEDRIKEIPAMVALGVDEYRATYRADIGVLTSWSAMADGLVADQRRVRSLVKLVTDETGPADLR